MVFGVCLRLWLFWISGLYLVDGLLLICLFVVIFVCVFLIDGVLRCLLC